MMPEPASISEALISLIPEIGQLIAAILSLIDMIVSLATGGEYSLATGLVKLFYDIQLATGIDSTSFTSLGSGPTDESKGIVQGQTYQLKDIFTGTIKPNFVDGAEDDGLLVVARSGAAQIPGREDAQPVRRHG